MIRQKVLSGQAFDEEFVFDIHGHFGTLVDFQIVNGDTTSIVSTLDRLGVNGMAMSSLVSLHSDCHLGNQLLQEAICQFPDKLYGYVTVSPWVEDITLDQYFGKENSNMVGMKIHAADYGSAINDKRYLPYLEYADKKGLPVLFHTWEVVDIIYIAQLAEQFRNARFIMAHSAMRSYAVKQEVVKAVRKFENIFVDTTISVAYDGAIEWIVSQIGADRVLYGSDLPFYDCRFVLGKVGLCRLSDSDKLKILGGNARKLLFG